MSISQPKKNYKMDNHIKVTQRSEDWFELRNGRFTSSKISALLSTGKRPMTDEELAIYKEENPKSRVTTTECIGEAFFTYCFEVAENAVFGRAEEDMFDTFDMVRGQNLEPVIFRAFKQQKELEFLDVVESGFFINGDYEGGSPDGLVSDDSVLEIKAPRRSKFFRIVRDGIDALDKEWIIQAQHQMRVTGRSKCYFVVGYLHETKILTHTIEILIDDEIQKLFDERLPYAIEVMNEYKQYLIEKFM